MVTDPYEPKFRSFGTSRSERTWIRNHDSDPPKGTQFEAEDKFKLITETLQRSPGHLTHNLSLYRLFYELN